MDPARIDFTWWKNVDFKRDVSFQDHNGTAIDLSGSTFAMDIKAAAGAGAALVSVTIDDTAADEGRLTLSFADGLLDAGDYVYDLIRIDGGERSPLVYGAFVILEGVTQP